MINRIIVLVILGVVLLPPIDSYGALFEQLAVSTRASALGNAVTAYPPGLMSIHYNPAGLTSLKGTQLTIGASYVPRLSRIARFKQGVDPATGEPWAPYSEWFSDPLINTKGKSTDASMVIPWVGDTSVLVAPSLGFSYRVPGSRWAFAVGQYMPFCAGIEYGNINDPCRYLGRRASIQRLIVAAPTAAYQLTDSLSIGVSVGIGMAAINLDSAIRMPSDLFAVSGVLSKTINNFVDELKEGGGLGELEHWSYQGMDPYKEISSLEFLAEDHFTTSYNIGLLWTPVDWFSFGACYQSRSKADMSGDYEFKYSKGFQETIAGFSNWASSSPFPDLLSIIINALDLPDQALPLQEGNMNISMTFPARAQFGVMLKPFKSLRLLCDAHWVEWSVWKRLDVEFDQKIQLLQIARVSGYLEDPSQLVIDNNLKDTWHFSYGLEYQPFNFLALRFGYEPRPSSVRDESFGLIPIPDIKIYSTGIGLVFKDKMTNPEGLKDFLCHLLTPSSIDLGFTYIKSKKYELKNNTSKNFNSTSPGDIIYNPYSGLDLEQEIEASIVGCNLNYRW